MSEYASHEVIDRITALLPGFAERAQETEDLRKVHPPVSYTHLTLPTKRIV